MFHRVFQMRAAAFRLCPGAVLDVATTFGSSKTPPFLFSATAGASSPSPRAACAVTRQCALISCLPEVSEPSQPAGASRATVCMVSFFGLPTANGLRIEAVTQNVVYPKGHNHDYTLDLRETAQVGLHDRLICGHALVSLCRRRGKLTRCVRPRSGRSEDRNSDLLRKIAANGGPCRPFLYISEGPSTLGRATGGVEHLPDRLLSSVLRSATMPAAPIGWRPLKDPDPETGTLNAREIAAVIAQARRRGGSGACRHRIGGWNDFGMRGGLPRNLQLRTSAWIIANCS